jgi:hypothetical protein
VSKSEDINTLFRRFGGDANSYQEIVAIDQARAAEQHWPLLGQLKPLAHAEAPPAKRASVVGERMAQVEVVIYKTVPQIVHVVAEPVVHAATPPVIAMPPGTAMLEPEGVVTAVDVTDCPALEPEPGRAAAADRIAHADLKSVFDRMLPRAPDVVEPVPASPLKRLIKW